MKVKYKKNLIWTIMGLVWIGLTAFIYFKYIPDATDSGTVQKVLLIMGLGIIISIYYFCMPLLTYAKVEEDRILLYKHGGFIKTKLYKKNLECCRVQRKDLEFYMSNGKDYAIHLDWCNFEQAVEFIKEIQKTNAVYEGSADAILNLNEIDKMI